MAFNDDTLQEPPAEWPQSWKDLYRATGGTGGINPPWLHAAPVLEATPQPWGVSEEETRMRGLGYDHITPITGAGWWYDPKTGERVDPSQQGAGGGTYQAGGSFLPGEPDPNNRPGAAPLPTAGQPQQQPQTFNPMAGWDQGKLNGDANTTKYQFGRWLQGSPFYNGGSGANSRGNMQGLVDAYNQQFGGSARVSGDDGIDFGNGWNKVDLINGNDNTWQWGAWNDPNAQGQQAPQGNSLASLMGGGASSGTVAPTWNAMLQNGSAYGQSPLGGQRRTNPNTLASLMNGIR